MRVQCRKLMAWVLMLAMLVGLFNTAFPIAIASAQEAALPEVVTAAVAGDFQMLLGAPDDWMPQSDVTEMTYYDNGTMEFIAELPEGTYNYKVALNDSWSESYPSSNKTIVVPEGGSKVIFRYDTVTHGVFDSINDKAQIPTAAVVGDIQVTSGDAIGWTPENPATEMTYLGGGIYHYSMEVKAGSYEYKVALNDNWDVSYPGDNKPLIVEADGTVDFYYNHNTHSVKDSINNPSVKDYTVLAGSFQSQLGGDNWAPWNTITKMHDVDEDGVYMFQAFLPQGAYEYKVSFNGVWDGAMPGSNIGLPVPAGGATVLFLFDKNTGDIKDSINDTPSAVQRYILFKYVREDQDYDGWNLWVWGTGKKDDQIDFTERRDGAAYARIAISSSNTRVGFKVRRGDGWDNVDQDYDRYIDTTGQVVTKVTIIGGQGDIHYVPAAKAPVNINGDITFYYRDEALYQQNLMHTLNEGGNGVVLKLDGREIAMVYIPEAEYFTVTVEDVPQGIYEYSYLVTKDGVTTEVSDPLNTDGDGKSRIIYIIPEAHIEAQIVPNSIDYNQNAVLSVDVSLTEGTVREIYADLSALGGNARFPIDTALNAGTISVRDNVTAGVKTIPITVIDEFGNVHSAETTMEVKARVSSGSELDFDWDEARIYFMLTDRFNNGDTSNDDPNGEGYSPDVPGDYAGGDFKGIIDKLDYLDSLGINTIWITPIVDNINYDVNSGKPEGAFYGYHGYWAKNFEVIDEHLGDLETFKALIDAAHDRGIKIMVDVVINHAGYGLKPSDKDAGAGISNYPTDDDRALFEGMFRTVNESGDVRSELSGLPDFITEDPLVRETLVQWQSQWLERARTDRGDTIDYFRVDTVKHVEDTTWKAFKNALTAIEPEHKLIGEWYGAGANNTGGQLQNGQMDSLLDFEFKGIAKNLIDGRINEAEAALEARNSKINNTAALGQFLSSHDEPGFLVDKAQGDRGKMKVAAALQITAKGQPVIYYGEEWGLSGVNNWPVYDNRYEMPWSDFEAGKPEVMEFFNHYQKLLNIRAEYSKVFSKGTHTKVAGGDAEGYLVFRRAYEGSQIFVALNTTTTEKNITLSVPVPDGTVYTDEYSGQNYTVTNGKVTFALPGRNEGGTAILATNVLVEGPGPVPEGHLRIHYNRPGNDYSGYGLWLWNDVASPSANWPVGATAFNLEQMDEYGVYLDIPLKDGAKTVGFLVVNQMGDKDGGDKLFTILWPEMNEVWIKQGSDTVYKYEPVDLPANTLRIHYTREDGNYDPFGVWSWGDVVSASDGWPTGAAAFASGGTDRYGAYVDILLTPSAKEIGFLIVNRQDGEKDGGDKIFKLLDSFNHLWVKQGDDNVYVSPYYETAHTLLSAEVVSNSRILLNFTMTEGLDVDGLKNTIVITDASGGSVTVNSAAITGNTTVEVNAQVPEDKLPLTITLAGRTVTAGLGWKYIDENYYYDGNDLGATYHQGSATLKLWSPKATKVTAHFYDKNDSTALIGSLDLVLGEKGVWSVEARPGDFTGVSDLRGYYYQYEVTQNGESKLVLDPYAKSMATFRVDSAGNPGVDGDTVGKAAIIDLDATDPSGFKSANIPGYTKREDAIIYEVHIRDFTSDPTIEGELGARWGSYKAFIEKLDYIKSLGVTHIQLLPVMAWYYGDEAVMFQREDGYSTQNNNYNWGYDPHSYFSPDGAYSENPNDPELRVKELKELIDAIHDAGMGVILDVVYTHMAKADFLEDIVPGYYFFQDADGKFLGGFGSNLATNRKMAEKLMIDSVKYWFEEYKIDGMRFDMMGDATYDAIQNAYNAAAAINPKALFIGEGWRTFAGHLSDPSLAGKGADQDWMDKTNDVGVFSDEIRNELKSGFGSEGEPRFITGGARSIQTIFNNIKGQPGNVAEDDPGDIVQYIEAHDNLTLYDVIAYSIKKDPSIPANDMEIHQRIRLGNALVLTSQGTAFLHAGQEYGRTKQWLADSEPEQKFTTLLDGSGNPVAYFIHDSYDSSDAINKFDWSKATNEDLYPVNALTRKYTQGLIALRKSTNAFRLGSEALVNRNVTLINAPEISATDLVIAYKNVSTDGTGTYYVFVNADNRTRTLTLQQDLTKGQVLVDNDEAGIEPVSEPTGFSLTANAITLEPLTTVIIKVETPSGGGNGGGSTGTGSTNPGTETSQVGGTTVVSKVVTATIDSNGKASASVSQSEINEALAKARNTAGQDASSKTLIEVRVDTSANARTVEASLPKDAVGLLNEGDVDGFRISTPIADMTFDSNALSAIASQAGGDVTFSVSKVDSASLTSEARALVGDRPVFDFTVKSGDKTISSFNGNVQVSVPYSPMPGEDPDAIVIYYINDQGELEIVTNCKFDPATGTVTFVTNHFSEYAVGYNKVTFTDVPSNAWYAKAVSFIAARGITNGTGNNRFSPDEQLTRGQFLVMVMRAYGILPDENSSDNFADAGNTYYTGYLAAAKRLGLTKGVGGNKFAPENPISRQEMFTLLYNILKYLNRLPDATEQKPLTTFGDYKDIDIWAKEALEALVGAGVVKGNGHLLTPRAFANRAQMAQVLYDLLSRD